MSEATVTRDVSFRILCVCTGNVFRSRIAEHLLRAGLVERLGAGALGIDVTSAGTGQVAGRPVHPSEAAALRRCGVPADDRPSRRLTAADVLEADLVLCADRSHRSTVLELVPAALRRTFLLEEFARVAGPAAARSGTSGTTDVATTPPARAGSGVSHWSLPGVEPRPESDLSVEARRVVAAAATFRADVPPVISDEISDPWGQAELVLSSAADRVRDAVPRILDPLLGFDRHRGADGRVHRVDRHGC